MGKYLYDYTLHYSLCGEEEDGKKGKELSKKNLSQL